ncbi:hypothetical protein M413DRAFT_440732 [Hebeloma cylindrosporum]|uniref:Uncharacterized protein n=1 Tax=Hebeloma cylindrosporum TaxID=76867 RepID=A0A0C2Z238_HEBCY|nr:hypothetical protein M413DRAFT_440732 [Hebeloma cylindrosporum h7]
MLSGSSNFPPQSQSLPSYSLQNTFGTNFGQGPQQQPFLSQTNQQDLLHQNADPNSPEVFKDNLRIVQQQVINLQDFAKRVLLSIQNAYQNGNSPAHTQADIATLKQMISVVIEKMRQSGVGALPIIPPSQTGAPVPPPSEAQLLANTTKSLQALYEKLQRSQESAAVAANLLSTDVSSRSGK